MSTEFTSIPLYPFSPPTPVSTFHSCPTFEWVEHAKPRVQSSALGEKKLIDFVSLFYLMLIWCHKIITNREYLCYRLPTSLHLASVSYFDTPFVGKKNNKHLLVHNSFINYYFLCCFAPAVEPTALHKLGKHSINKIDPYPSSIVFLWTV